MRVTNRHSERGSADVALGAIGVVVILAVVVGLLVAFPSYSRWNTRTERAQNRDQSLQDARNEVTITNIRIGTTSQKVSIAKQEAQIRYQQAVGVREAQDEIAKTLTPLYVQFEMTQALTEIAKSGKNSSVIYIPTGSNGLPLVAGAPTGVTK
jgi:Tfp pilus assembly protein PilE